MTDRSLTNANQSPATDIYVAHEDSGRASLKTLLLGGAGAGAVAGLAVLLMGQGKETSEPRSRLEQARMAIEDVSNKAMREGASSRKDASKRRKKLSKKARQEQDETMANIASLLSSARDEVRGTVKDARKQAPDISSLVRQFQSDTDDARKRGKKLRKQAKKDVNKARTEASSFMDILRSKAADVEHLAESYVDSELLPKLREFEKDASSALEKSREKAKDTSEEWRSRAEQEVIPQARDRVEEFRDRAEKELIPQAKHHVEELRKRAESDYIPEAKERVEEFRKRAESDYIPEAKERAEHLKEAWQDQADVAVENWEKRSEEASKKLGEASEMAKHEIHDASESVKRGGRETRSLLIWLGLAGTVIYKVFLNEEQQKKVREVGMDLFGEAKEIYSDVKGETESL